MKKLYGYYGGSRAYGLPQTSSSDWDYYSIGTSTKVTAYKIYPNIKLHQKKRTASLDVEKVELCAYLTYLMNGFAFQVESLFVPQNWMDWRDPRFEDLVLNQKHLLIDRCALIENVTCNIESFRKKTVNDIIKLKIVVKNTIQNKKIHAGVDLMHKEYAEKGYYHKDYVHGIRLAASLVHFLKTDVYPYRLEEHDKTAFQQVSDIKNNPDALSRQALDGILDAYLNEIQEIDMGDDEDKFRFDGTHALKVIRTFYP